MFSPPANNDLFILTAKGRHFKCDVPVRAVVPCCETVQTSSAAAGTNSVAKPCGAHSVFRNRLRVTWPMSHVHRVGSRLRSFVLLLTTGVTVGSCVPMASVVVISSMVWAVGYKTPTAKMCVLAHGRLFSCVANKAQLRWPTAPKNLKNLVDEDKRENTQKVRTRTT